MADYSLQFVWSRVYLRLRHILGIALGVDWHSHHWLTVALGLPGLWLLSERLGLLLAVGHLTIWLSWHYLPLHWVHLSSSWHEDCIDYSLRTLFLLSRS